MCRYRKSKTNTTYFQDIPKIGLAEIVHLLVMGKGTWVKSHNYLCSPYLKVKDGKYTKDKAYVTCEKCLKIMEGGDYEQR